MELSEVNWLGVCNLYLIIMFLVQMPFTAKLFFTSNHKDTPETTSAYADSKLQISMTFLSMQFAFVGTLMANSYGLMSGQLHPRNPFLSLLGVILAVIQLVWFFLCHLELGPSFAPTVSVQDSQKLETGGPYRYCRHPMYASLALRPLCVLLLSQNWLFALSWLPCTMLTLLRVKREERLLLQLFGQQYANYRMQVGAFWPWKPLNMDFGLTDKEIFDILAQTNDSMSANGKAPSERPHEKRDAPPVHDPAKVHSPVVQQREVTRDDSSDGDDDESFAYISSVQQSIATVE
jgi:protein-S-isoprenylcysteine O-methyltransferase Ste14